MFFLWNACPRKNGRLWRRACDGCLEECSVVSCRTCNVGRGSQNNDTGLDVLWSCKWRERERGLASSCEEIQLPVQTRSVGMDLGVQWKWTWLGGGWYLHSQPSRPATYFHFQPPRWHGKHALIGAKASSPRGGRYRAVPPAPLFPVLVFCLWYLSAEAVSFVDTVGD